MIGGNGSAASATTTSSSWLLKAAAVAAVPVVATLLFRSRGCPDDYETDFDSFLVKKGEIATGVIVESKVKDSRPNSGPFDGFLKDAEDDTRDPAVFSTFLKSNNAGRAAGRSDAESKHAAAAQIERPSLDMARVLLLYGTEYGFSKEIVEMLAAKMKQEKLFWPTIVDMTSRPEGYDFSKEQVVLVACSTQGDGVPPTEARDFCEWLFAGKAGALDHLKYSVCALGDKSYTHFCKCGKTVDEAFEKAGAFRLAARQDINKEDYGAVKDWIASVLLALPTLGLKTIQELGGVVDAPEEAAAAPKRWGKSRPFPATVSALEGLCNVSGKADKNTYRVELDLGDSGLAYLPGDALGIYPTNCTKVVDELLAVTGLSGSLMVPVPSHHYEEPGVERSSGAKMTLSQALAKCYDLRSPKTDLLKLFASLQEPVSAVQPGGSQGGNSADSA